MPDLDHQPSADRRTALRYECDDDVPLVIVTPGQSPRWARMHDVSSAGIGLSVSGPYEIGADLWLRFTTGQDRASLHGEVRHVAHRPDGSWAIGCRLDGPASSLPGPAAARLQALLQSAAHPGGPG